MATQIEQLYGPEHYDGGYFDSMKKWLGTQKFRRGVELGFAWGMSAMAYLETQDSPLISIDVNDNMKKAGGLKRVFGDRWLFLEGDSSTTLLEQGESFDYIYIDGDHTHEAVVKDLEAAHQRLAKDGVIVCDDYGNPCGVKQAVDEFRSKYGYTMGTMDGNPNGGVILRKEHELEPPTKKH